MNIITSFFREALFRPLFNLLVGITDVLPTHNIGVAIVLLTIISRLILLPFAWHQARQMQRNQHKMKELQSQLQALKEKHKDDKAKQAEATMALYREAGINPASGCLPLLIQLPILITLYRVFLAGVGPATYHYLYSFVSAPPSLTTTLLGINLAVPSLVVGICAGVAQFIQMRWFSPTPATQPGGNEDAEQVMASMQKNMMYIFPVMTVFITLRLPAALALYWVISTGLAIIQQLLFKRFLHLKGNPTTL